ncbi:MAG: replication-associated recombination protein A [Rhizobiales bacterium]|nr:replication-associated recombination protein A [Hyphomicrobiales bacterium]
MAKGSTDLFASAAQPDSVSRPLADLLRPAKLSDIVGQEHLTGADGALRLAVDGENLRSMIFWGPAGTGKTSAARLLAEDTSLHFEQISAIFSGVQDLRRIFDAAKMRRNDGFGTLLFVDEIHRFNRAQQDGFLPHMEDGTIVLVGATTENPSFELNSAILSRAKVLTFKRLDEAALDALLTRAEEHAGRDLPLDELARASLISMADGDGRVILGLAEEIFASVPEGGSDIDTKALGLLVQRRAPIFDKAQDGHYNLVSALHKSIRGSDPEATLYWLARMLVAGEDPLFVARRLIRMASEDIGLADPVALQQTISARDAYQMLGSPEGELALAQAAVYLAVAPKSNALYGAYKKAIKAAKETGSVAPPKIILNAPTGLMKDEGYGAGYQYDHDLPEGFSGQNYFPDGMARTRFYTPVERGFEREVRKRLDYWSKLRDERANS